MDSDAAIVSVSAFREMMMFRRLRQGRLLMPRSIQGFGSLHMTTSPKLFRFAAVETWDPLNWGVLSLVRTGLSWYRVDVGVTLTLTLKLEA